jgi:hypothetical protein
LGSGAAPFAPATERTMILAAESLRDLIDLAVLLSLPGVLVLA